MSKEKLWELYLKKNPSLLRDEIRFTQAGLLKFFNTTYDAAYKQGFNQLPDEEGEEEELPQPDYSASVNDLLNLFGMRR